MARGLHIIFLYADSPNEWNCSEWRAKIPSDCINWAHERNLTPHTARLFHLPSALDWNHPAVQKSLGTSDVLVFQRNVIDPAVWAAMDYWRALGKLVLVDLDDSYPQLPPSNPAFAYWIENRPGLPVDPVEALAEGMRHADGLTSPSEVILEDWAHIVPGFYVPNWTHRLWYENLGQKPIGAADLIFSYKPPEADGLPPTLLAAPRQGSEGAVVLGWGGSISHVDSWIYSGLIEALDKLFDKRPNVRLKFCGNEERLQEQFKRWGDKVWYQGGVQPKDWPQVVTTFDIGLAPLDMRPLDPPWRDGAPVAAYDERRSWLKAAEYLTAGVPWVASQSRTYAKLAHMGTIVENTPEAWFMALDRKIEYLEAEKKLAAERRAWALRKITFEANIGKYMSTLDKAMAMKMTRQGKPLPGIVYVVPQLQSQGVPSAEKASAAGVPA